MLFFVFLCIRFIITFSCPFLVLFVRPISLSKALQQRPRFLPRRTIHRVLGQRQRHAVCAAVAVDENSSVVTVAGACFSLSSDVSLSHPIPNRSIIGLFTSCEVSNAGAELTRRYPVWRSRGRGSSPSWRSSSTSRVASSSFAPLLLSAASSSQSSSSSLEPAGCSSSAVAGDAGSTSASCRFNGSAGENWNTTCI